MISVLMPNEQTVDYNWTKYRVTPRHLQKLTGLTFFSQVPQEVANALRDRRDEVEVHVSIPHFHDGK